MFPPFNFQGKAWSYELKKRKKYLNNLNNFKAFTFVVFKNKDF